LRCFIEAGDGSCFHFSKIGDTELTKAVTIKKYGNRRLYDTEKNTYVTLAKVAERVKEGQHVEVVDARTGEDVTAYVLTQILLEESKKNNILLPVPLLHLCIQFGDTLLKEFFGKHLQQAIRGYVAHKSSMDEHFGKLLELGNELTTLSVKRADPFEIYSPFVDFLKEMTFPQPQEDKEKKK